MFGYWAPTSSGHSRRKSSGSTAWSVLRFRSTARPGHCSTTPPTASSTRTA